MRDLFIAHSSKDAETAAAICTQMEAAGIQCWIAPRDMALGGAASYGAALIEAINSCSMMVVILSSHSNQSVQVIREVERAVAKGIPVLPFEIEKSALSPDLEFFLSATHRFDASSGALSQHIRTLVQRVSHLRDRARESSGPPVQTNPDRASWFSLGNLLYRRLPQYLALYVGGIWAFVQFIDFLEGRYALSPNWSEFALLYFGLLIPGVVLFIYNHGRPGKDEWKGSEKVGIPTNLVIAPLVLFTVFDSKDLSPATTKVTGEDETGKRVQWEVPAASHYKRLAMFDFEAPAEDTALAWLRYALPLGVWLQLNQDMFIDVRIAPYFLGKVRRHGFKEGDPLRLALKHTIAEEHGLPYFTDAKVARDEDQITVELTLYETAAATPLDHKIIRERDPYALIDQISETLKQSFEVPRTDKVADLPDLPVSEFLPSSTAAFRHFADGMFLLQSDVNDRFYPLAADQWPQAARQLEKAVQLDSTFALAWYVLHKVYANSSQQHIQPLEKAMDLRYRLPKRLQYDVMAEYHVYVEENHEKAHRVAKIRVDRFPKDIGGYLTLAEHQDAADNKEGRIVTFQKILELDPAHHERLIDLAKLYERKGDLQNALHTFTRYAERYPSNGDGFVSIGRVLHRQGKHDQARTNYENALLFAPKYIGALVHLAAMERDLGNFDAALQLYSRALETPTIEERVHALEGLAEYYEFRGQFGQSVSASDQLQHEMGKIEAPLGTLVRTFSLLPRYVRAGQTDRARRELRRVAGQLQYPFDWYAQTGEVRLALQLEQPDVAERAVARLQQRVINDLGFKAQAAMIAEFRGQIAELRGQLSTAIRYYEEVQKLEPTRRIGTDVDWSIQLQIGRCYRKLRQPKKAIEHLEKALVMAPFGPHANYELGLALLDKGDRAKARQHLERAVAVWSKADPAYKDAAEARAKLDEVLGPSRN